MPSSPTTPDRLIAVAVPVPAGSAMPPKGARVRVPLGARRVTGCVVDTAATAPDGARLRDVLEMPDAEPYLPPAIVDLALWVGDYYLSGPGDALSVALPPSARDGQAPAFRTVTRVTLTPAGRDAVPPPGAKQRQALEALSAAPAGLTMPALAAQGITRATVRTLAGRGLVALAEDVALRDPFEDGPDGRRWALDHARDEARALTAEQQTALDALTAAAVRGCYETILLHGVTGSGKTEVYLQLATEVVARGGRVLMLVPEIALTPAAAGIFRSRFLDRVAIQHSGLSSGERHDQWHRIRHGDVDVVVGTRSAVFAPLEGLRLIVVDEEHEGSYKQEESPRYHGRDTAVMRGRMEGALVVLGSATPSLETYSNVEAGRYAVQTLRRRVADRPLATVRIVDMRAEYADRGPDVTMSRALVEAMTARLERGEQSLILLNRRGFATVVFCRECASSMECPHCSVALTFHRRMRRVRCHYCNYAAALPGRCGVCGGQYLEQSGFGTERLEADVREALPGARVVRVDRDTVRRKGAIGRILRDVAAGRIDVVVGTQMIAKGHDFPAVTLVGVVSADVGLGLADFRASERTFQLLTQVVGRAGRGNTPGEAIVQSLYPRHYCILAAADQDYATFFARESEFRQSLRYPPAVALINVVVRSRTLERAMEDAHDLARRARRHGAEGQIVGPAPAALSKIKDEYRAQFFVKGRRRAAMRTGLAAALAERPDLARRVVVDVDPVSVI